MTKLEELIAKLSELFELDKADLDFGIHRIIKSKHKQVREYLETRLPQQVETHLGQLAGQESASQLDDIKEQVVSSFGDEAINDAGEINEAYANTPLGEKYQVVRESSSGAQASGKVENEVFSHLLEFFSRYYEDADFMSLRRRTAGRESYAIPYNGEEVVLHWANKDQYYIKSSEDLKDYTFTVPRSYARQSVGDSGAPPSGDGSYLRVQFRLTKMDAVQNNNKASRVFQLDEEQEITATDDGLVIPFHFAEGKKRAKAAESEWEESILESLPKPWRERLATVDATYTGSGERNVLQKHLRNYTKKHTSDYFIHKDLGGFLRRELDFYIKNEVMFLDDIENRPECYLNSELRKIKAIRAVAHDLIDFMKQFEEFQKKLWLKKKFVVETNWCISLDRIPKEFFKEIATNDAQREEWVKLFAIDEITEDLTVQGYSNPLTANFLAANPNLLLDTKFFTSDFKARLLSKYEDLENSLSGLMLHSDNFQGLRFLDQRYQHELDCIYIDPPYNTDASAIDYKNGYKSSSWVSLMSDRLSASRKLLNEKGVLVAAIDDEQQRELSFLLSEVFNGLMLGVMCVRSNPSGRPTKTGYSVSHEYLLFAGASSKSVIGRLPPTEQQQARFNQSDELGQFEWRNLRREGSNSDRSARRFLYYPIYIHGKSIRIPKLEWDDDEESWIVLEKCKKGEEAAWPTNDDGDEKTWRWEWTTVQNSMEKLAVRPDRGGRNYIYYKRRPHNDGVVSVSSWFDPKYSATEHGTAVIKKLFGSSVFSYPKSIHAVVDSVFVSGADQPNSTTLDFFAGSGTTGHAVIELNRRDSGNRKYLLIEMGEYFDTVLLPRIKKVSFSRDWEDGKPTSANTCVSQFIKYCRLESYEDALNNLTLDDQTPDLLGHSNDVAEDYLLRYFLNVETKNCLLDCEQFKDPFNYQLKIYDRESGEAKPTKVDLPETFNYLLGLKVRTMQMRSYARQSVEPSNAANADKTFPPSGDGSYTAGNEALVIEGENPAGETVLVIWRNVESMDNKKLDKFVSKTLRINTADTEYAAIYINGDTTLNDPHKKILLTEQVFHDLMFDVEDV